MITPTNIQLRLHPREQYFPTNKEFQSIDPVYPVYYKIADYAYNGRRYESIIYEIHYAINGAIGLNSMDRENRNLGYHSKDTERIIILYDAYGPAHVFFSAHQQEGRWFMASACEFDDNRLIVYSSLNSHSHHPKSGINWRIFGIANDYCSKRGPHINLTAIQDDDINYRGQNEEVINTTFKSIMLPFYQRFIPKLKIKQAEKEAKANDGV